MEYRGPIIKDIDLYRAYYIRYAKEVEWNVKLSKKNCKVFIRSSVTQTPFF